MLRMRFSINGRKNLISYRIIIAESKFPRDGKFIEKIGFFNFNNKKNIFYINKERFKYWKNIGVKISKRIIFLIKKYNFKI